MKINNPEILEESDGFFNFTIPRVAETVPLMEKELLAAKDKAYRAMLDYGRFLEEDLLARSHGEFAIGAAAFDAMVQEEKLLPYSHGELRKIGRELFEQTENHLNELAKKKYPGKSWKEVIKIIGENHPPKAELVSAYRDSIREVREFVVDNDLVTMPAGENLEIKETPAYLRNLIPFAAYLRPSPYEEGSRGEFWITPIGGELSSQQQEALLKGQPYAHIQYTVAHESYPGHHLQLSWQAGLDSEVLRRSQQTPMIEGWAFYCEDVMKEHGYLGKEGEFAQLKAQLWRAARVIIDVGLHTGKMSFAEAVEFLEEKVGLPQTGAVAEIKRYTRTPTQPMSYYIGKLEIIKLKKLFLEKNPGMSLKEFHHKLLNCGSIPPSLVPLYYGMQK